MIIATVHCVLIKLKPKKLSTIRKKIITVCSPNGKCKKLKLVTTK